MTKITSKNKYIPKGKLLWGMIIIFTLLSLMGLLLPLESIFGESYSTLPVWYVVIAKPWAVVDLIILAEIWLWKKAGAYGFLASTILGIVVEIVAQQKYGPFEVFVTSLLVVLMFVAIYRKWEYFN